MFPETAVLEEIISTSLLNHSAGRNNLRNVPSCETGMTLFSKFLAQSFETEHDGKHLDTKLMKTGNGVSSKQEAYISIQGLQSNCRLKQANKSASFSCVVSELWVTDQIPASKSHTERLRVFPFMNKNT